MCTQLEAQEDQDMYGVMYSFKRESDCSLMRGVALCSALDGLMVWHRHACSVLYLDLRAVEMTRGGVWSSLLLA